MIGSWGHVGEMSTSIINEIICLILRKLKAKICINIYNKLILLYSYFFIVNFWIFGLAIFGLAIFGLAIFGLMIFGLMIFGLSGVRCPGSGVRGD